MNQVITPRAATPVMTPRAKQAVDTGDILLDVDDDDEDDWRAFEKRWELGTSPNGQ
jgi:hypothetical protein